MDIRKVILRLLIPIFPFINNEVVRDKWVINKLRKLPKNQSLLDAGAGEQKYRQYCKHLKYKSQDFNQYNGQGNNIGFQTNSWDTSNIDIVCNITAMPVKKGSFDNILCTEVLEHLPYPDQAIKEFSRIIKEDGKLLLTAPFCSLTHFAPYHFCTGFNIYWYEKILNDNQFEIIEFTRNGNYFEYMCQELLRTSYIIRIHSKLKWIAYLFYLIFSPIIVLLFLVSKLNQRSEELLCFGYFILARKKANYEKA